MSKKRESWFFNRLGSVSCLWDRSSLFRDHTGSISQRLHRDSVKGRRQKSSNYLQLRFSKVPVVFRASFLQHPLKNPALAWQIIHLCLHTRPTKASTIRLIYLSSATSPLNILKQVDFCQSWELFPFSSLLPPSHHPETTPVEAV